MFKLFFGTRSNLFILRFYFLWQPTTNIVGPFDTKVSHLCEVSLLVAVVLIILAPLVHRRCLPLSHNGQLSPHSEKLLTNLPEIPESSLCLIGNALPDWQSNWRLLLPTKTYSVSFKSRVRPSIFELIPTPGCDLDWCPQLQVLW